MRQSGSVHWLTPLLVQADDMTTANPPNITTLFQKKQKWNNTQLTGHLPPPVHVSNLHNKELLWGSFSPLWTVRNKAEDHNSSVALSPPYKKIISLVIVVCLHSFFKRKTEKTTLSSFVIGSIFRFHIICTDSRVVQHKIENKFLYWFTLINTTHLNEVWVFYYSGSRTTQTTIVLLYVPRHLSNSL